MKLPTLLTSVKESAFRREALENTMRILIRVAAADVFSPTTARIVITRSSGEPVGEVVLNWGETGDEATGLRAILEALKIAGRYRARRVVIYIDDPAAASIAAGDEKAPAALVGLVLQVRALSHTYRSVDIRHGMSLVAPTLPDLHEFAPA